MEGDAQPIHDRDFLSWLLSIANCFPETLQDSPRLAKLLGCNQLQSKHFAIHLFPAQLRLPQILESPRALCDCVIQDVDCLGLPLLKRDVSFHVSTTYSDRD